MYFKRRSTHESNGITNTVTYDLSYGFTHGVYSTYADAVAVEQWCQVMKMNRQHARKNMRWQFFWYPVVYTVALSKTSPLRSDSKKSKLPKLIKTVNRKNPLSIMCYRSSIVVYQRKPSIEFTQAVQFCDTLAQHAEENYSHRVASFNARMNSPMVNFVLSPEVQA